MSKKFLVLVLVLFVANIAAADITTGLQLYLDMEDDLLDDTANNNDGTKQGVGAATYVASYNSSLGKAISLDGSDDYVSVADDATLDMGSGDLTISAWVKSDAGYKMFMSKGYGSGATGLYYQMYQYNAYGYTTGNIDDGTNTTRTTWVGNVPANEWHLFTLVRDGGNTATLYVDGGVKITVTDVAGDTDNSQELAIGAECGGIDAWVNGAMDEVRVYNRALSDDDVLELLPEPATIALLGLGGLLLRRRKKS